VKTCKASLQQRNSPAAPTTKQRTVDRGGFKYKIHKLNYSAKLLLTKSRRPGTNLGNGGLLINDPLATPTKTPRVY